MDSTNQASANGEDVPSSTKSTNVSVDDTDMDDSSNKQEDGPPPFNRIRSFKTKQLVRSQAINESHSPPRQPSPRPGEKIKIAKKKSVSIDLDNKDISTSMKNLAIADKDQDRSVSPLNNNNTARANMNLINPNNDVPPGNQNIPIPPKPRCAPKIDFHQFEYQVSSADRDDDYSNQSIRSSGNNDSRNQIKNTSNTEIVERKETRNSNEMVRRRVPSKQDSGISCWGSFNCGDETIATGSIDEYMRSREETDHHHNMQDNCGPPERVERWTNKKTGATLTVTRGNSGGNPRLLRKQSSGNSFDNSHLPFSNPYMIRDSNYDWYFGYKHEKLDNYSFIKDILNKNARDRQMLLDLEREMIALIKDPIRRDQVFPCYSSYGRLIIHRCAEVFGLEHKMDHNNKNAVNISKPLRGGACRIPSISPFSQWCTVVFPEEQQNYIEPPLPAKSILKRDAHSLDEDGTSSSNKLVQSTRSKSFEQREEEYEKVRRRIFSSPERNGNEQYSDSGGVRDDKNVPNDTVKPKLLIARPDQKQGKLLKVQSLEQNQNGSGDRAPAISKANSFGGYGGRQNSVQNGPSVKREDSISSTHSAPPHTILSRHGEATRNSWLSPGSSGYKTNSGRTNSITPSPINNAADPDAGNEESVKSNVLWVVTDMSSVPPGAVIIHPQTGQALTNSDGSVYHFDPEKPPHSALLQMSQPNIENQKEKRRSRLEKQQAMLSPGINTDHLSPIDKRLLPDREYSPIKSPKSEQCEPIMEDDFSDISSRSHCQCCNDEHVAEPVKQNVTQFILPSNIPQQKPEITTVDLALVKMHQPPQKNNCEYNTDGKNPSDTVETCNECFSIERRGSFQGQPLYCDDVERGFYTNIPSNPHCCEQFNEHNVEAESFPVEDPMHFDIRTAPPSVQIPLPHPQVVYGVSQDAGVTYGPSSEILYSGQILYPQSYRIQESEVHNQYQVPHQMLVTVPKPPEHEVPTYMTYPPPAPIDARTPQLQHLAYQVPNWNCWPQMAVYNQPTQPAEEQIPKIVNPSSTPNSYVPVQGDPSMAIPQVFYQHPANLIPQQHTQYVYSNQGIPVPLSHIATQSQYYPAYPPQPTLYNVPPPGLPDRQTPAKSPDKPSVAPPVSKSPKNNLQQSSNTPSLCNTPLNDNNAYCPPEINFLPYYMQQNTTYPAYYNNAYNMENNQYSPYQTQKEDFQNQTPKTPQLQGVTFNFIQKNQIEPETKVIQDDSQKIIEDKKIEIKSPPEPSPDIKSKSTQSDYTIPNITAIQTHPVRVITPQGDVIKYNNPNAKLQNFLLDKNVEKIAAEKKEQEKKAPVPRAEVKDGILGSPENRFGWPKPQHQQQQQPLHHQQQQQQSQQQQYQQYQPHNRGSYNNFSRSFNRNPNKRYTRERMSPNVFERPPNHYDVPNSPIQRASPANHWSVKNQNDKPTHILQRTQSLNQSAQSPPLLPFPPPSGLLPSLYNMRNGYNSQIQRRPRQIPPMPNNFTNTSNLGLMQAAALQTQSQHEMFFRQFPWLRRAAAAAPLLGPAPSLMGSHGRQRLPHPNYRHQQQQNLYR